LTILQIFMTGVAVAWVGGLGMLVWLFLKKESE
jgi:nitrate reductase NapE component